MQRTAKTGSRKLPRRKSNAGRRQTPPPKLQPISADGSLSMERQTYDTLRLALMTGAILPGQMLTSRSLSSALAVSVTPIMVALKRLEADGALESKNKSAFYVKDPNKKEFRDILEVRLSLELLATSKAAKHVTPTDMKKLKALNSAYERYSRRADSASLALERNFQFHFEVYKLSKNEFLVEKIEAVWLRIGPALHRYVGFSAFKGSPNIHGAILDALERHDGEAAAKALREDLESAFDMLLPLLPE
jgi:GntR family transcriptional regulator, colanic acid and biofilm gene transcriptional regulator